MKLMKVERIGIDVGSHQAVVLLRETEGDRVLPIWVGALEANAIAMSLENVSLPRPLTHDLTIAIIQLLGATVTSVLVDDVRDGTFFAQITLTQGDTVKELDSRPSDAIALALRTGAPIYATEKVLAGAGVRPAEESDGSGNDPATGPPV
jgi:bifunctional DNase/RNase